jgi:hypothetical protein
MTTVCVGGIRLPEANIEDLLSELWDGMTPEELLVNEEETLVGLGIAIEEVDGGMSTVVGCSDVSVVVVRSEGCQFSWRGGAKEITCVLRGNACASQLA